MLPYLIAGAIGFVVGKLLEEDEAPKYADGGSVLLAPNGKPSNLTPQQYELVRTNEFKAWFGDWQNDPANASKVVDENGEPLVVWRGVKSNKNYEYQKTGYNYFAKNKSYGKVYGDILHPFFLNIRNPLDLEFFNKISSENGLTSFNNEGLFQIGETQLNNKFENELDLLYLQNLNDVYHKFDYLFKNGDGIIGYDIGSYGDELVFVTKKPEQIKLADGSNTKFDSNNPDIRFNDGGGRVSNYREFYDNLQIENGSKYIGQKFANVFPFIGKKTSPAQIRISVKEYNNLLGRLENDNYTTKGMKTADLNRLEKRQKYIDKKKYLSRFYLDPSGRIIGFDNSDNAYY